MDVQDIEVALLHKRAARIFARCDARAVPLFLPAETAELMQIDEELAKLGEQPYTLEDDDDAR